MKIDCLFRLGVLFIGCACCFAAEAFPTKAEFKEAQSIVNELMDPEISAFNSKKKKASEVAAAALRFAGEAEGDAAKFLLYKGAFLYQMRAAEYDGAKKTIESMYANVNGVPDKVIADMLAKALKRVSRRHCSELHELLQQKKQRIKCAQEAEALEKRIKAYPGDVKLKFSLGERYAVLGDWKKAIAVFAETEGKMASVAAWEKDYPNSKDKNLDSSSVADFWWEQADSNEEAALAYRLHASYWYRKAISAGELSGLKVSLAEKRIAEAGEADPFGLEEKTMQGNDAAAELKGVVKVQMGKGGIMELAPCPKGEFVMGGIPWGRDPPWWTGIKAHKVTISRQFWTGRMLVTRKQYVTLMKLPHKLTEAEIALGGMDAPISGIRHVDAVEFCDKMTKKYKGMLPPGYVFRLPTEAEWEYACCTDSPDTSTPYCHGARVPKEELQKYVVLPDEKKEILKKAGINPTWPPPGSIGGRKIPNAWGLYDMLGNLKEYTLDRVPTPPKQLAGEVVLQPRDIRDQKHAQYMALYKSYIDGLFAEYVDAVDPLLWRKEDSPRFVVRGFEHLGRPKVFVKCSFQHGHCGFRVVMGPDLIKEKGLKK